jgi:hypothetical protein
MAGKRFHLKDSLKISVWGIAKGIWAKCALCNSCSQTYLQENIKWIYYVLYVGYGM